MDIDLVENAGIPGIFGKPAGLLFLVDSFPVGSKALSTGDDQRFVTFWELAGRFQLVVEGKRVFAKRLPGVPGLNEKWPQQLYSTHQVMSKDFVKLLIKRMCDSPRQELINVVGEFKMLSEQIGHPTPGDLARILPRY
ncbi:MAG TPA: hypothetical protein VJZ52_00215 [Candidatus Paceibacterota bacterium]|nr:hypothetical protein [Candidatus Paceibacterota bacterium]